MTDPLSDEDLEPMEPMDLFVARAPDFSTQIEAEYKGVRTVRFWCKPCKKWHVHGWPLSVELAPGHRAAHCHLAKSPWWQTGYNLKAPMLSWTFYKSTEQMSEFYERESMRQQGRKAREQQQLKVEGKTREAGHP